MRANFIFSEVWIGLRRNLTMTIAVIVTVAIAMALLGVGLMINAQVTRMKHYWASRVEISVFLCKKDDAFPVCKTSGGMDDTQKKEIENTIKAMPQVQSVAFETSAQAFEIFKATYADNPLFVSAVRAEDMPESFRVKLKNPEEYSGAVGTLKTLKGVSNVINHQEILDRFFGLLERLRWAALVVAGILVVSAILLIGNTVRLSAYNRRRETGIMRLVGASNLYIQLPFVMEGVIAGLLGGVVAAVLLIVSKVFLFESVQIYLAANSQLEWNDVAWVITLTMIVGVVICVLASFVTLRRYLKV
ncbi:cell division transport system permease protein [Sinosporangium album]|uniref:Cell division protein FtsX n=1 Tax=Sinosporangium album TaxID=504805 RepID=A0A1G7VXH1_9ACTN|nr:permease-like cell division protein FtsX [Sinosporangium album]SDG63570.1 cell division transport system permease protein [Sinosporangium album]